MSTWIDHLIEDDEQKMTAKKKAILVAAVELMSEKGYEKVATSEIAKRAGVAEGTIFRHFKTKRDLLYAIVIPTFMKFIVPNAIKTFKKDVLNKEYGSFEEFVTAIIQDRFLFIKKAAPLFRVLFQEVLFNEELRGQVEDVFQKEVLPSLEKVLRHFEEKGEIKSLSSLTFFRTILGNVLAYAVPRFVMYPNKEWDDEKELKIIIDIIVCGLSKQ